MLPHMLFHSTALEAFEIAELALESIALQVYALSMFTCKRIMELN